MPLKAINTIHVEKRWKLIETVFKSVVYDVNCSTASICMKIQLDFENFFARKGVLWVLLLEKVYKRLLLGNFPKEIFTLIQNGIRMKKKESRGRFFLFFHFLFFSVSDVVYFLGFSFWRCKRCLVEVSCLMESYGWAFLSKLSSIEGGLFGGRLKKLFMFAW